MGISVVGKTTGNLCPEPVGQVIGDSVLYHSLLIAHYSGEFATSDDTISKTNDRRQVSAAWKEHIVSA
jgi:hypothetical protein